jgi:hypothetical protein
LGYHKTGPEKGWLDPTEQLRRHIEYSRKRDHWARRAIALLEKGEDEAGMDAAEKAERWELRVKSLEPASGTSLRQNGPEFQL